MRSGTILIVDGDTRRLASTSDLLRLDGFELSAASSASVALVNASRDYPELILLWSNLSDISATDLFHRLAKASQVWNCFIIEVIERNFSPAEKKEVLGLPAAGFISEYSSPDELIACLHSFIRQKRHIDNLKRLLENRTLQNQQSTDSLTAAVQVGSTSEATGSEKIPPLRERFPSLYRDLLSRYEAALKKALQNRIYKTNDDVFTPFHQIARDIFTAQGTDRDAVELHFQTLRKVAPNPDLPQARGYLEVGRTAIVGLLGDLVMCYRSAMPREFCDSTNYESANQFSDRSK